MFLSITDLHDDNVQKDDCSTDYDSPQKLQRFEYDWKKSLLNFLHANQPNSIKMHRYLFGEAEQYKVPFISPTHTNLHWRMRAS